MLVTCSSRCALCAVNCILFWATRKEAAWCPQCRVSFSQLRVYRRLDGTPRDLPDLESVCLLKRTTWYQEYAQVRAHCRLLVTRNLRRSPAQLLTAHSMWPYLSTPFQI